MRGTQLDMGISPTLEKFNITKLLIFSNFSFTNIFESKVNHTIPRTF